MAKLKKPARPKAKVDARGTPIMVRFGGRNQAGPTHRFTTEAKAKTAISKQLKTFVPWCERYNNAGLEAITDALNKVPGLTFNESLQTLECLFDTRYDMCLVVTYWRENA